MLKYCHSYQNKYLDWTKQSRGKPKEKPKWRGSTPTWPECCRWAPNLPTPAGGTGNKHRKLFTGIPTSVPTSSEVSSQAGSGSKGVVPGRSGLWDLRGERITIDHFQCIYLFFKFLCSSSCKELRVVYTHTHTHVQTQFERSSPCTIMLPVG